jgi:prepilin-type N-terminal cleavage/methylation domain-containing protein
MKTNTKKWQVASGEWPRKGPRTTGHAFTLIEILIAIGLLSLVLAGIYSSWTAILRASKVGLDAAAAVQRSRIAVRTIEDALMCVQSFAGNQQGYYAFYADSGSDGRLSFVARLPKSFPRSGRFGDYDIRRVEFAVQPGPESSQQLVLRQKPLLWGKEVLDWDVDEKNYPLVLAKYVSDFKPEFYDKDKKEWVDEWVQAKTNTLPMMVRITLRLAETANSSVPPDKITRIISLPTKEPFRPAGPPPGGLPGGFQPIPGGQPFQPPGSGNQSPPPGRGNLPPPGGGRFQTDPRFPR